MFNLNENTNFCDLCIEYDINQDDLFSMNESILYTMDVFVNDNAKFIANENFDEMLKSSVYEVFSQEIKSYLVSKGKYNERCELNCIPEIFEAVYCYSEMSFYQQIMPKRSFKKTFIRTNINVELMKTKIKFNEDKEQPDQRTTEWYKYRNNLITASNAWKCFENSNVQNQIIYEKCKPFVDREESFINTSSPLHHGVKYEDVSIKLYEEKYKTKVADFGCLKHDDYSFLGASPDGINVLDTSPLFGRMLEIKNPVSRVITGIPKKDYWIQMQLQMEVSDLNECDFLETKITEFENEEAFIISGGFTQPKDNYDNAMGILMYFSVNAKPVYELAPFFCNEQEYNIWFSNIQKKYEDNESATFVRSIYWKVDVFSCVLVLRNKLWFKKSIEEIKKIWDIIEYERVNGYEHRAPKKRAKSIDNTPASGIEVKTDNTPCLIDLGDSFDLVNTDFDLVKLELDFDTSGVQVDLNIDPSNNIL